MTNSIKIDKILNELLFGEAPFTRYRAPEPEVFVELIPLLDDDLLEEAVYLYHMGVLDENQYNLLFERLKPFIPEDMQNITETWEEERRIRFPKPELSEDFFAKDLLESLDAISDPFKRLLIMEQVRIPSTASEMQIFFDCFERTIVEAIRKYSFDFQRNSFHSIIRITNKLSESSRTEIFKILLKHLEDNFHEHLLIDLLPLLSSQLIPHCERIAKSENYNWVLDVYLEVKNWEIEGFNPYQSPIYKYLGIEARKILEKLTYPLALQKQKRRLRKVIEELWGQYGGALPQSVAPGGLDIDVESEPAPPPSTFDSLTSEIDFSGLETEPSVVNVGVSEIDKPETPLNKFETLAQGSEYYFLVEIGKPLEWTLDKVLAPLPSDLPKDSLLKVVLFSFRNELEITTGEDIGWILLNPTSVRERSLVVKVASHPVLGNPKVLEQKLFFKIKTPNKPGTYRLRCNVYYEQILLQSRIVQAKISEQPQEELIQVLESIIDYDIGPTLNLRHLDNMHPQDLSIMLNSNDDGTHSLRVFGEKDVKYEVSLDDIPFKGMIKASRGAYRKVSWGNKKPWKGKKYRYEEKPSLKRFKKDLIQLAKMGYNIYWSLLGFLDDNIVENMRNLSNKNNHIEFIIKDDKKAANYIIPIALVYDQKLDDTQDLEVCSTFLQAYKKKNPLDETPCFQGNCPEKNNILTMCPSGFWGFRNSLGLSIRRTSEIDYLQEYDEIPLVGICAASSFDEWPNHRLNLEKMIPSISLRIEVERNKALNLLQESRHLFYFYCHGDLVNGIPYLRLGEADKTRISPTNLYDTYDIKWDNPKPLVILNGCHTTALNPEKILSLVNPLLRRCHAAGVIGTEITIFESLATRFAEECIQRFLNGEAIGEAIRKTRVSMLGEGNPLGLVYVPYVHNGLQLKINV